MRATSLFTSAALAGLALVFAPLPSLAWTGEVATAQNDPVLAPGWLSKRIIGRWNNSEVRITFWPAPGDGIYADAYLPREGGKERRLRATMHLNAARTALEGEWQDITTYSDRWPGGKWTATIVNDRVVVNGLPTGGELVSNMGADNSGLGIQPFFKDWLGEWQVHGGTLKLFMEGGRMIGTFRTPAASGLNETRRQLMFIDKLDRYETEADTVIGLWQSVGDTPLMGGEVRMTLLAGKQSFGGSLAGDPAYGAWRGHRAASGSSTTDAETLPAPKPVPATPVPTTPAPAPATPKPVPSTPAPSEPAPAADGFQPLGRWDVRVDKVENPRDDRLTHVYVTLRNAGSQNLLQTGDVWVYLETSDGVTQRSGQGLRAMPGPAQLFGSPPPVVLPGREIKAKYIFDRHRGVTLTSIMVMEGEHRADFAF